MQYVVKIAQTGSLIKAAEELSMAPPNLSRAVKEFESNLGIIIFRRSHSGQKGMLLTPRGEEFVYYAKRILNQINDMKKNFEESPSKIKHFSISVPRASYVSRAFANFSKHIGDEPVEIFYKETNSFRAIKNIMEMNYKLGMIRYASNYEKYFNKMFEEKGLKHELITQFRYSLIMSKDNPLASKKEICFSDLRDFIEIAHADTFVPSMPFSVVRKEELPNDIKRRIFVFERGSQFEILSENPKTFMLASPVSGKMLDRYALVQRECFDNQKFYKDILIYRNNYVLSELDETFVSELHKTKPNFFE